jgi:succinate dehydrogenase / fumarate reductase iron-sulfur subunit
MSEKQVIVRVKRQAAPHQPTLWEEFALRWRPAMNVVICLRDIAENPITRDGKKTTPITFDSNCLEEICGSCAMLINGKVSMACSALVDKLEQPIRLEPMTKFPVVRDLAVDRQFMFESLKRVKAWIPIDGTYSLGEGPYPLSRCITCGSCLEVCPQVNQGNKFIGAAAISQVRLFNMHPTGAMHAKERIQSILGEGGIEECANAQNCVIACPKGIPLTESLAEVNRQAWKESLLGWFVG